MVSPEQPRIVHNQSATRQGFSAGFGAVFGIIAAIVVIILIIAALNYKTPYQRWSDCISTAEQNGVINLTAACGPDPGLCELPE